MPKILCSRHTYTPHPTHGRGLENSNLAMTNVTPQNSLIFFSGVSIVEDDGSGITMELELQWDGNPNIVLDIRTKLGVALPIQVIMCYTSNAQVGKISNEKRSGFLNISLLRNILVLSINFLPFICTNLCVYMK